MPRLGCLVLIVCTAACGNITRKQDDAGPVHDDGPMKDGPPDTQMLTVDAMLDAKPDAEILPPTEAREITPGGVTMTGATFTFDVQLGHYLEQKPSTGTTFTMQGNTAVKP